MQSQVQTREVSKESRRNNGSQWDLLPISKVLCIEIGLYEYYRRSHDVWSPRYKAVTHCSICLTMLICILI